VIVERTTHDLALSDLVISRVRSHFGFDFIGTKNTPPGLVNDALLSTVDRSLHLFFSHATDSAIGEAGQDMASSKELQSLEAASDATRVGDMFITAHNREQIDWTRLTNIADQSYIDFQTMADAETHAARLMFFFNYDKQSHVTTDLRHEYFARLFDRFRGNFLFVDPASYGIPIEINEWNIHPSGIPLAWEGEYTFENRIAMPEIASAVQDIFATSLAHGWPTQLPVRDIQGVPCRFTLMPRYF